MKRILSILFILLLATTPASAVTKNIVPRADSEGGVGTSAKYWANGYFDAMTISGTANLPANSVDAITEISASLKSGSMNTLVTGLAGSTGHCAEWDANGDLVTSGAACSSGGLSNVVEDTTPQLGGNLDVYGNSIVSAANGIISINPDGTGTIRFPDLTNCDTIDTDIDGDLSCGTDASGGGGTPNVLDLGDDASNESSDLIEIATTGDTNSIFSEPTADKLLITLSNNWPSADTADALSANGANAPAGNAIIGVDASGAAEGAFDVIVPAEIDTYSELNAIVADVTLTHNGLIDSSAEIAGIVADETGSGALVFGTSPIITSPTISTSIALPANALDAITEIAAALKSGSDNTLITGTAGTSGNCAKWDANGDLVDNGATCGAGGSTAWDSIGDPTSEGTIAFASYEQTITTALDDATAGIEAALTIENTDLVVSNDYSLLDLIHSDDDDDSTIFMRAMDNDTETVVQIGPNHDGATGIIKVINDDAVVSSDTVSYLARFTSDGDANQIAYQYTDNSGADVMFQVSADGKVDAGQVFLKEQAAASTDVAASGQIWVKTATPNQLWFTDDAGTDTQLGVGGGGTGFLNFNVQSAKLSGDFIIDGTMGIDGGEGHWRLTADATTHEYAAWQTRIPPTYSSAPVAKIQYAMASATANKVDIEVDVMCISDGDAADINTLSFDTINEVTGGTTVPGTAGYLDEISIALSNADSMVAGDNCVFRLGRDTDDADDTATGDMEIVNFQVEFTE